MRKEIGEREPSPWGYGIAWCELDRRVFVCYPIPINILAHYLREIYYWLDSGVTIKNEEIRFYFRFKEELKKEVEEELIKKIKEAVENHPDSFSKRS